MFRHLLLPIIISISGALSASPARPLSQSDAVALAIAENRELKAVEIAIEAAEARLHQAGRLPNPELGLDYSDDFAFNNEGESVMGLSVTQDFPLTRRLKHAKSISRIGIKMARAELREAQRGLVLEVRGLVLALQAANAQIGLRKKLVKLNQTLLAFIDKRVESGEVSILEKNQAELELKSIKQELVRLEAKRDRLLGELRPMLGQSSGMSIAIDSDLKSGTEVEELKGYSPDVLEKRSDYALAELSIRSAEARVALAKSERWADISLGLMFENEKSVDDPKGLGTDRFLGVGVSIPLPLWNRNKGNIRESIAEKRQAEERLIGVSIRIENEIEAMKAEAIKLHDAVHDFASDTLLLAEENAEITDGAYRNGQVSLLSVLKAQEQRFQLESTYIDILHDYEKVIIELKHARADDAWGIE